jgi:hypothetical protein
MMRPIRHALFALPLLALASGCGGPAKWFYAEITEPGICKTIVDQTMAGTQPGQPLSISFTIPVLNSIPLFDPNTGEVVILPLSVTFDAKSGIQDFNSVDTASILAVPDPANPDGLTDTEIVSYEKAAGFTPGTKLTVEAHKEVNLVPYLVGGDLKVEAKMSGGLPQNPWVADITGCLSTRARFNYLGGFGINL